MIWSIKRKWLFKSLQIVHSLNHTFELSSHTLFSSNQYSISPEMCGLFVKCAHICSYYLRQNWGGFLPYIGCMVDLKPLKQTPDGLYDMQLNSNEANSFQFNQCPIIQCFPSSSAYYMARNISPLSAYYMARNISPLFNNMFGSFFSFITVQNFNAKDVI